MCSESQSDPRESVDLKTLECTDSGKPIPKDPKRSTKTPSPSDRAPIQKEPAPPPQTTQSSTDPSKGERPTSLPPHPPHTSRESPPPPQKPIARLADILSKSDSKSSVEKKRETNLQVEVHPDDLDDQEGPDDEYDYWGGASERATQEQRTITRADWVEDDDEETEAVARVILESTRAAMLKSYKWSESTINFVDIPVTFQDAKPLSPAERRELLRDTPTTFNKTFPCKGISNLGDDRKYVRVPSHLWFLEKGAPKLHTMMTEELKVLMYLVQECGDSSEKIGLEVSELTSLLKKIVTLHVDTMKMISKMQTQNARRAMNRSVDDSEDPQQNIISDRQREADMKKVEIDLAYQLGRGRSLLAMGRGLLPKRQKPGPFGRGQTRRPRQGGRGFQQPQSTNFFFKRGRGRGRGRGSRGRGNARPQEP